MTMVISAVFLLLIPSIQSFSYANIRFSSLHVGNVQPTAFLSAQNRHSFPHYSTAEDGDADVPKLSAEETEAVGNLVADDEWMGLGMEITELVRTAVIEDVKKNTREFTGNDDYKIGDISKELDVRVKDEVAKLRGKDEYELGDFTMALDQLSKDLTCELTGKDDYEFGDLSSEIDSRIKNTVASFCGKDEYELGDLSVEVDRRVRERVADFTGNDEYEFGDISREINNRRKEWVSSFLGEEAAKNYQFGDVTKQAISNFTGKEDYEFGDVTKKLMSNVFGKRKRGGSN
eukprot:CAMPEP_0185728904 /NCGR_PEP_ID=MMETSP1171-20130828/4313_1 /TAXON_ID=374046 /ORGANISM="Helicotheca tamensis, Strain CCMP826" /LENGTH=288 /DNA_ID=CAMNT_0028397657 /DNA_START=69 /DNA_END=935 /DNA_ORIENTATION=+